MCAALPRDAARLGVGDFAEEPERDVTLVERGKVGRYEGLRSGSGFAVSGPSRRRPRRTLSRPPTPVPQASRESASGTWLCPRRSSAPV